MPRCLILLFTFCLFPVLWSHAAEPAAVPRETVFFAFDDQNIAWQHNLKLTLVSAGTKRTTSA